MKRAFRFPPFEVNRMLRTGLAVQLADALRTTIHTGYYGPGDILPPICQSLPYNWNGGISSSHGCKAFMMKNPLLLGSTVCYRNIR